MLCVVNMVTSIVVGIDLGAHDNKGTRGAKQNNGHNTRNRSLKSSKNHLKPSRRMMNFTNNS